MKYYNTEFVTAHWYVPYIFPLQYVTDVVIPLGTTAQSLCHLTIAANRFTAFAFPLKQSELWRRRVLATIALIAAGMSALTAASGHIWFWIIRPRCMVGMRREDDPYHLCANEHDLGTAIPLTASVFVSLCSARRPGLLHQKCNKFFSKISAIEMKTFEIQTRNPKLLEKWRLDFFLGKLARIVTPGRPPMLGSRIFWTLPKHLFSAFAECADLVCVNLRPDYAVLLRLLYRKLCSQPMHRCNHSFTPQRQKAAKYGSGAATVR